MADEGHDAKRRGRRLFASRRRQTAPDSAPPAAPDPAASSSEVSTVDLSAEAAGEGGAETMSPETSGSTETSGRGSAAAATPVVGGTFTPSAEAGPARVEVATVVPEAAVKGRARGKAAAAKTAVVEEDISVGTEAPGEGSNTKAPDSAGSRRGRSAGARTDAAPELGSIAPTTPMVLPAIVAIANQKGGVGKTTTAVNLGAAMAELGYRVLVVDLDPQGNATTGLGINARDLQLSIYDVVMNDAAVEDCVEPTSLKNLFVAPATIDLAGAEIELVPAFSRELKLRRALEDVREQYDVTLIDCPPSLGLLTVNALAAADDVVVPIQCEYYALEGLGQLLRNVALVRTNLNPSLQVRGIVLTMYDARTKLADQVEQEVREHFGPKVYRAVVPRTVRLGEAPSFGQPIIVFDPTSRGAIAYRELAKEVCRGATRRSG